MEIQQAKIPTLRILNPIVNKRMETKLQNIETSLIRLMYYSEINNVSPKFYFLGLTIEETLHYFLKSKILNLDFVAQYKDNCIDNNDLTNTEYINELLTFINQHHQYNFFDFKTTLDSYIQISSHDDDEISIIFPKQFDYYPIIKNILTNHKYNPQTVIRELKENKDFYLKIKQPDIIEKKYQNFTEYWNEND